MSIDHAQAPIDHQPINHNSIIQKIGNWIGEHKLVSTAIGSGMTTGIIATGLFLGTDKNAPSFDGASNTDRVAGATKAPEVDRNPEGIEFSKIDPNSLTVDEFYNDREYPESERVKWAGKKVTELTTPDLLAKIQEELSINNRPPIGKIVMPSVHNNGDDILAQNTVAGYAASTAVDPNEGRKLLSAFMSKDNPGFEDAKLQIGGGQKPVLATYEVAREDTTLPPFETPTFYDTRVGNYAPNGVASKVMMIQNEFSGNFSEITVKFIENRWVIVDNISVGDPNWINNPSLLDVK